MPILAQDVATRMRAALDAEGADYYRDGRDIIPAINNAIQWLENVINAALGEKKFSEEIFQDLIVSGVFRTSKDSRISFDKFPVNPWTILAIYPLPVTDTTGSPTPLMPNDKESYFRSDLYHVRPTKDGAKRLTLEQWSNNKENPFEDGYDGTTICAALQRYAYLNPVNYNPSSSTTIIREIELRPVINKGLVTIFWAKNPTLVSALTDNIEFPQQIFQMILAKALQFISYKQGDQTTLYLVTAQDVQVLINTLQ